MSKQCTKCKETKPLTEFGTSKQRKGKPNSWCKQCVRDSGKRYRGTIKGIYTNIKGLQKFYERKPVIMTYEEFEEWYLSQEKKCGYCYLPEDKLHDVNDSHNSKVMRLTIDCMDNSRGYEIGNIIFACNRCNFIKNDFLTYEQMFYYSQTFIKPVWEQRLGFRLT